MGFQMKTLHGADMKIKEIIPENADTNKLILGIALISIVATSAESLTTTEGENLIPVYEVDENGVQTMVEQHKNKAYISKFTKILSANNYAPIKTLYKLQSILDDVSVLKSLDLNTTETENVSFKNVFSQIKPYINEDKVRNINELTQNIEKAQSTVNQIGSIKNKISNLPDDLPRGEKIKTIINEIPNLTDIPVIEEVNTIRNMLSLINLRHENLDIDENESEEDEIKYNDIVNLVDMFEK